MSLYMLMMIGGAMMMLQPLLERSASVNPRREPTLVRLMRNLSDAFVAETSTPKDLKELVEKIK